MYESAGRKDGCIFQGENRGGRLESAFRLREINWVIWKSRRVLGVPGNQKLEN